MASGHLRAPHPKAEQMAAPTSSAHPSKYPLPTGSRPQMASSGPRGRVPTMSALHPTADMARQHGQCPLMTHSGHREDTRPRSPVDSEFSFWQTKFMQSFDVAPSSFTRLCPPTFQTERNSRCQLSLTILCLGQETEINVYGHTGIRHYYILSPGVVCLFLVGFSENQRR